MADLNAALCSRHVALVLACQGFAQVDERYDKTMIITSSHRGEAARSLIEPNEIRTLPARQALVLADVAAQHLVRVKSHYGSRRLAQ